jgi:hypothetical protein
VREVKAAVVVAGVLVVSSLARPGADPLPSWNDGTREWAYDRASAVGGLDAGLAEASRHNWTVVDMTGDWNRVFPFGSRSQSR